MIDKDKFSTKEELFKFLKANKPIIVAQKKSALKTADAVSYCAHQIAIKDVATKESAEPEQLLIKDSIEVEVVINTTRLFDSHDDVHINGLWKKTLKDGRERPIYHIQEHRMTFDHVISDEVKAYTREMSWSELGYKYEGTTEALIFKSTISKSRNPYMFEQYARGYVKNHSVGMRYISLCLCVNSTDSYFAEEKANWDKYIDEVANKKAVEDNGYFWAVTEAALVEGSAVVAGSNWATPTQSVKGIEPSDDTPSEPVPPLDAQSEGLFAKFININ